jgi:hypothetical protein
LVLGLLLLPETLRPGVAHGRRKWFDRGGLRAALQVPAVGTLILIFFLSTFAFANFEPTLALLTQEPALGLTDQNNFLIFAYVGLVLALVQGLFYRRLALHVREISFMWMGSVLMGLGLAGVGTVAVLADQARGGTPAAQSPADSTSSKNLPPGPVEAGQSVAGNTQAAGNGTSVRGQAESGASTALLVGLLMVLAVAVTGFAFMVPSVQALISRLSDPAKQGEVLGINQSANAMARILGPFLGVLLYYLGHVLPYVFGVALLAVVLIMTLRLGRKEAVAAPAAREATHAA